MGWRLAKSLTVLWNEANAVAPNRRKGYDGTIGDAAHSARPSRHNPNNAGVVCALDITHDPTNGMDTYDLFDWLRKHPHPDLAYVISNRRVSRRSHGWTVDRYTGASAHDHHIHIAVGLGPDSEPYPPYDNTDSWGLREWRGEDMTPEQDKLLKQLRVSDLARSYDMQIVKAMLSDDDKEADRLEAEKKQKVQQEKSRLGI